jgi:hypothetical protein
VIAIFILTFFFFFNQITWYKDKKLFQEVPVARQSGGGEAPDEKRETAD